MRIVDEFRLFHRQNPQVYKTFKRFALEAKDSGRERFGAREIWERMRWYIHVEIRGSPEFKLNDHFPPFYARKVMKEVPALKGFFELRVSVADAMRFRCPIPKGRRAIRIKGRA